MIKSKKYELVKLLRTLAFDQSNHSICDNWSLNKVVTIFSYYKFVAIKYTYCAYQYHSVKGVEQLRGADLHKV